MIKSIDTQYKGYVFRSRLEARWAVFFDSAGIDWKYEHQGYFVDGKPYLPDFFLPEFGFFEVKGTDVYDPSLFQRLADGSGIPVLLAVGDIPDGQSGYIHCYAPHGVDNDLVWEHDNVFLRCDACGSVSLQADVYAGIRNKLCCQESRHNQMTDELMSAKSARFEHGQKGNVYNLRKYRKSH